jgi:hypothetical protein
MLVSAHKFEHEFALLVFVSAKLFRSPNLEAFLPRGDMVVQISSKCQKLQFVATFISEMVRYTKSGQNQTEVFQNKGGKLQFKDLTSYF